LSEAKDPHSAICGERSRTIRNPKLGNISIVYSDVRPGEKLYKELIKEGGGVIRTPQEKILVLRRNFHADANCLNNKIEELVQLAREQGAEKIKKKLKEIIPEYQPFEGGSKALSRIDSVISAKSP